mgnify:CR=1 FL=1
MPFLLPLSALLAVLALTLVLLSAVLPPFLRGFLWSISLPSPLDTFPFAIACLRALFLAARSFLALGVEL